MTQRQFRMLLVVDCAVAVIALAVAIVSPHYLPAELRAYFDAQGTGEPSWQDALRLAYVLGIPVLSVVTTVGLWRFRRWARGIRLWSAFVAWALPPEAGPVVMTSLAYSLVSLGTLIEGGVLALVYLSPMTAWFTRAGDAPRDG